MKLDCFESKIFSLSNKLVCNVSCVELIRVKSLPLYVYIIIMYVYIIITNNLL